ncbi:hypothetical protein NM688_g7769 [Phlebia brevispora]|uniref:Uncharacterized protein n=1 Tax=Phlebia brevispora TaxID=194682 RepID=A0ACC1S1I9_9APHY|nr:hypothetical protein NM688_g7769 [Phlebia brevispora]
MATTFSSSSSGRFAPLHFRDIVHDVLKQYKNDSESESESKAHRIFREQAGHQYKGFMSEIVDPSNGFSSTSAHEWANFGQGAPEVGDIPGAHPRPRTIKLAIDALEYAPSTGVQELREAVANLYNHTYRQDKESQYTYENVCIVPGGRAGLSRVAAVIGDVYCRRATRLQSYQIPDCTAYDQVLGAFKRVVPVPTTSAVSTYMFLVEGKTDRGLVPPLDAVAYGFEHENKHHTDVDQLRKNIRTQDLKVVLLSNLRNPTGQVIQGDELYELVRTSCEMNATLILDELYSWYIYLENEAEFGESVSSAAYIDDVNEDSIIIIDSLTKNWRLPGFRVCWVIAPKNVITALSQSGYFLGGGANHPLQLAAIPLLEPGYVHAEKVALQKHFKHKRDHVLTHLQRLRFKVAVLPDSTFYIWL